MCKNERASGAAKKRVRMTLRVRHHVTRLMATFTKSQNIDEIDASLENVSVVVFVTEKPIRTFAISNDTRYSIFQISAGVRRFAESHFSCTLNRCQVKLCSLECEYRRELTYREFNFERLPHLSCSGACTKSPINARDAKYLLVRPHSVPWSSRRTLGGEENFN